MWLALVFSILRLINFMLAVVVVCSTCYNKRKSESSTANRSGRLSKSPESTVKATKVPTMMESSERTDVGSSLGTDNPQIQAILAEPPGDDLSNAYLPQLEMILDTAGNYMWGMKKHMAADEAAWKELAKRITLLQAEGYDVRAGTKEAKYRRMTSAKVSTLMEKVTRKRKKRSRTAKTV